MKKGVVCFLFLLGCFLLKAQSFSRLDSICRVIQSRSLPIEKKFHVLDENQMDMRKDDLPLQVGMYETLLKESLAGGNADGIVKAYSALARLYMANDDIERSKALLDSAGTCIGKLNDARVLAYYHHQKGICGLRYMADQEEAYNNLYKSLYLYGQTETNTGTIINILSPLSINASLRKDSVSVKQLINMGNSIRPTKPNDGELDFMMHTLYSDLYKIKYAGSKDESYIDSIVYFEKRIIDRGTENPELYKGFEPQINYAYTTIVEYEIEKGMPDMDLIDSCLRKMDKMDAGIPSVEMNLPYVKALVALRNNALSDVEKHVEAVKMAVGKYDGLRYAPFKSKYYALMSRVCEIKGDYKRVIDYDNLRTACELEMSNNDIKAVELQFLAEKKNDEILALERRNSYQKKMAFMISGACFVLLVGALFVELQFRSKRRAMKRMAFLQNKEKEEAEQLLKKEEEYSERLRYEKLEALSEFHVTEMEIEGKNKELEQLEAEKQALDEQLRQYEKKVYGYEHAAIVESDMQENQLCDMLKGELGWLIIKRLKNRGDYIEKLDRGITEAYIKSLKERYEGNLTLQNMKYCIGVAIGMGIGEMAECFSIEPASVHSIRSRLRKRFRLEADADLELFLRP